MKTISTPPSRTSPPLRGIFLKPDGTWRPWTVPACLAVAALLAYGIYATRLGYFWDDWIFVWARHFRGLEGLKDTFFINRPPRAYFEALLDPLLGIDPQAWQAFGLLARLAQAVSIWWLVRQLWPGRERAAFLTALFSLLYPGFSQQYLAMTYHYFWFFHAFYFLSLGLMVRAVRNPGRGRPALVLSWVLCGIQLFTNEYLFGLELLRPAVLWLALKQEGVALRPALRRAALAYLPYLAVIAAYLYWRVFVFAFPSYKPVLLSGLRTSPLETLAFLAGDVLAALRASTLDAWTRTVQVGGAEAGFYLLYAVAVLASLAGLLSFQARLPGEREAGAADRVAVRQMLALGAGALLLAGLPSYIILHTVTASFQSDRLTMPFWFPVGLLLAGLLELLPRRAQGAALASGLAALAIGAQLHNGALFQAETRLQNQFAWQLAWRAPGFESGTLLLSDDATFPFSDDQALSYLLNWAYFPGNSTDSLPVAYASLSVRLGAGVPALEAGTPVSLYELGPGGFRGSTDQVLVVYFAPPSCLRILDPADGTDPVFLIPSWNSSGTPVAMQVRVLPPLSTAALPLSDPGWILSDPAVPASPPQDLLGMEPEHGWCYYFERAELARQVGDWVAVERLGTEALAERGLRPADLSELLIFVRSALELGDWPSARERSTDLAGSAPLLRPALCALWQAAAAGGADGAAEASGEAARALGCPAGP